MDDGDHRWNVEDETDVEYLGEVGGYIHVISVADSASAAKEAVV